MPVSSRIRQGMAAGSWIRRMFEEGLVLKQRFGAANVFDLSIGNPVVEPPGEFLDELRKLAAQPIPGMHRYMENAGYPETRAAVAAQLARETGLKFNQGDIVMTCGAAGALNVVLRTLLDPGDEVIVFAPYFMEYGNYVDNHGGVLRVVPTDGKFLPRLDLLEQAVSARTRAVIINSPNNPTGVVYSEGLVHELGQALQRQEARYGGPIFLISDEPYRKLIYDGLTYPPIWPHHRHSIVVTSHSKDLALPGERIGYLAIHPDCDGKQELMDGFIYCNRILGFVNAPALMQHLVRYLQGMTVSIASYQEKRDFLYENLTALGYSVVKPQGAFYFFPKSPVADELVFIRELQQHQVLAVPGRGFGTPGYFRLSYCTDDRTLEGALRGLRRAAQKFRPG